MRKAALSFASVVAVMVAADVAHKATTSPEYFHPRSAAYAVVVAVLAVVWAGAILATGSVSMALSGGVLAGGALGNLASLAFWPGVPNPIELEPIAFNLADVFVIGGFVLTAGSALAYAVQNRERLREPVSFPSRR